MWKTDPVRSIRRRVIVHAMIREPLIHSSAASLAKAIRAKELSATEVVQAYLQRIEKVNPSLNAVVMLAAARAVKEAKEADARLSRGESVGPLHGVPMTIKDSFDTEGVISTAGTLGRKHFIPAKDATVVERLRRAGAILLGKTNTPEIADGIETVLITDGSAGSLMRRGEVDLVVVGADRIAANGDVANKIGTYAVAVLAKAHAIPFYVAAPISTVDLNTPDGSRIPIEERNEREVTHLGSARLTPRGARIRNPAFDVTPAEFVTAIVTERGIARPPYEQTLAQLVGSRQS